MPRVRILHVSVGSMEIDSSLTAGAAATVTDVKAAVGAAVAQDPLLQPHGSPPPVVLGDWHPRAVLLPQQHRHKTASGGATTPADSVAGRTRSRTADSRPSGAAANSAEVQTVSSGTAATPLRQRPAARGGGYSFWLAMLPDQGGSRTADSMCGATLPRLQYVRRGSEPLPPRACHIILYQQVRFVRQFQPAFCGFG